MHAGHRKADAAPRPTITVALKIGDLAFLGFSCYSIEMKGNGLKREIK